MLKTLKAMIFGLKLNFFSPVTYSKSKNIIQISNREQLNTLQFNIHICFVLNILLQTVRVYVFLTHVHTAIDLYTLYIVHKIKLFINL